MKKTIVRVLTPALLGSALLLPLALHAQPAKAAAEPDTIVQLEEFRVTTTVDTYSETTASAAGKVPLDMKDVPATLQVLNASFIGDKLASSLEDLYPYVVGMTRESPAAAGFTLRGYTNSATNTMINNLRGRRKRVNARVCRA